MVEGCGFAVWEKMISFQVGGAKYDLRHFLYRVIKGI